MSIHEHLDELEQAVRQYEIEWRRFFGGSLDTPPQDLGQALGVRIRNLYQSLGGSTVARFRLRSLEGRFNSLREHFRRSLREAELRGKITATAGIPREVEVGAGTPVEDTQHLYETLFGAERKPIEHEAFHRFLMKEAERIRARTQCRSVVYFLDRDEDRYKLRARTIERSES